MVFSQVPGSFSNIDALALDKSLFDAGTSNDVPLNLSGVICTVGPACANETTLTAMLRSGMRVARLNFSHGDHAAHGKTVELLKGLREKLQIPFAIALDTKGPEIRTGDIAEGAKSATIVKDSTVTVSNDRSKFSLCSASFFYCDYPALGKLTVGTLIYVDDGNMQFKVTKVVDQHTLECKALNGGELSSKKGVNLPNVKVELPSMTEQDKKDLRFGVEKEVDMVFASFVRSKKHVEEIKSHLKECGDKDNAIYIIPKIENNEGVENYAEILAASEGIMIARGDLGSETPLETVPLKQKMMVRQCLAARKPFIVATQMLESMIANPRATRAEVSDVANAVLDGASCVMLSGESAKGQYPLQAVRTQATVAAAVERVLVHLEKTNGAACTVHPAETLARHVKAEFVVAMECAADASGATFGPELRSALPNVPVMCLGTDARRVHQSNLFRGMLPVLIDASKIDCKKMEETTKYFVQQAHSAFERYAQCKVPKDAKIVLLTSCPGSFNLSVVKLADYLQ